MEKSLYYAKRSGDTVALGCAYLGLGEIHQAVGSQQFAEGCFEKAIRGFKEVGDWRAVEEMNNKISKNSRK